MNTGPLIDWALLGRIALDALVAALGIVVVFGVLLRSLSLARTGARAWTRSAGALASVLSMLVIVGLLVWAFLIIITKT